MSSFVVIAGPMYSHQASQGVVIITVSALKHSHFICKKQGIGKETVKWWEELQFKISQISDFIYFSLRSLKINLRHSNVCITALTFMCSHLLQFSLTCSHCAGWWHRWLHIDKTYKEKISVKTWTVFTGRILAVIHDIIIWILHHKKA